MRSVHDNAVYAYTVDCENQRIVLHTSFEDTEPVEYTDVVFNGVVAHSFQHILPSNILFDIDECDLETMIKEYSSTLSTSWQYGWPPIEYDGDLAKLANILRGQGSRAFIIYSSYGMSGWILARDCQQVERSQRKAFD